MRTRGRVPSGRDHHGDPDLPNSGDVSEPHYGPECRLFRIPDAMRLLSLSRSVIYEQIRSGRLRSVTQGRTRLVPAAAITDYIDLLVREADDGAA